MKIQLIDAVAYTQNYTQKFGNLTLPLKTAYKLNLLQQEMTPHVNFYQKKLQEIRQEFKDISDDDLMKNMDYISKINELLLLEVEIKDFKFKIDDFDGSELTPNEVGSLSKFIEE